MKNSSGPSLLTQEQLDSIDSNITMEMLQSLLPDKDKRKATPQLVREVSELSKDDTFSLEEFISKLVDYKYIISDTNHSLRAYAEAIKYVSLINAGYNKKDAYSATFPSKVSGLDNQIINARTTSYHSGKLVQSILEQSKVKEELLFAPERIRMFSKLADLALNSKSEFVQMSSAKAFLEASKPDNTGITVNVDNSITNHDTKMLIELRDTVQELTDKQHKDLLEGKMTLKDFTHKRIVNNDK